MVDQVKQLIRETFALKGKLSATSEQIKSNTEQIQEYFDATRLKEFTVAADAENDVSLVARKVERATINYDANKLKEKLAPDVFNEIVVKQYVINDFAGLVSMLKAAGVSPAEFKKFVAVNTSINKAEVKRLYGTGDITKADIKGCYTASVTKSIYIAVDNRDE